jgi:predicted RNA binding protein YcfA (HicA-like mRNA interferase family)
MTKLAPKECVLLFVAGIVASFAMIALLGAWALLDTSVVRSALWLGFSPRSAIRAGSLVSMPGFAVVRQRGSHIVMRRGAVGCVIPNHRELKTGTLAGVLKQAGVTAEQFVEAMR